MLLIISCFSGILFQTVFQNLFAKLICCLPKGNCWKCVWSLPSRFLLHALEEGCLAFLIICRQTYLKMMLVVSSSIYYGEDIMSHSGNPSGPFYMVLFIWSIAENSETVLESASGNPEGFIVFFFNSTQHVYILNEARRRGKAKWQQKALLYCMLFLLRSVQKIHDEEINVFWFGFLFLFFFFLQSESFEDFCCCWVTGKRSICLN